ncbi:MAG: triosephosphate isomerase [Saprospiraceae bacterium]|jgi:triosephosphate isomerase
MKRKRIAAANWKMNTTVSEGVALMTELLSHSLDSDSTVVICAPSTHLHALSNIEKTGNIHLGAQNIYPKKSGAYTGEVSSDMIQSVGADHVVIGHSERREYFNESNSFLAEKLRITLDDGLTAIFCCGEGLEIRKAGNHVAHVVKQLEESFANFSAEEIAKIVIAYEPIWAIGTGETASPEQAQAMHLAIRDFLKSSYGNEVAETIPILYGGSVKPANAKEIFGQADVDGGLVGGASLKAESFAAIVNSFS